MFAGGGMDGHGYKDARPPGIQASSANDFMTTCDRSTFCHIDCKT
jgi:hypothetical protein